MMNRVSSLVRNLRITRESQGNASGLGNAVALGPAPDAWAAPQRPPSAGHFRHQAWQVHHGMDKWQERKVSGKPSQPTQVHQRFGQQFSR